MAHSSEETQREGMFRLKVGVALAVTLIKNKPAGVSAAEFSAALATKMRKNDREWKEHAHQLQQELDQLKLHILIPRTTENTRRTTKTSTETAGHDDTQNMSQDLLGSCGSGSETPDLLPGADADSCGCVPLLQFSYDPGLCGQSLPIKVHFLQSLCSSVQTDEVSVDLWLQGQGSVLAKMDLVLDSVVSLCQDPLLVSNSGLILSSCRFLAQALDRCWFLGLGSAEVRKCVEGWMKGISRTLLHGDWTGDRTRNWSQNQRERMQLNDVLSQCLIALGGSTHCRSFLIGQILCEVSAVSEQLWSIMQENSALENFPLVEYENSCYMLRVLEELLLKLEEPHKLDLDSQINYFLDRFKQRIFQLSEEFSLFSMYLWKVLNLLRPGPVQDHQT